MSSDNLIKNMEVAMIKEHLLSKKKILIQDIHEKFEDLINDFENFDLYNILKKNSKKSQLIDLNEAAQIRKKSEREKLPEKCFEARNSLLTDLFEINHIKTIYNIFIVMLILLFLTTIATDYMENGELNIGLTPITSGFGGFLYGVGIWTIMQMTVFLSYYVFRIWAITSKRYHKEKSKVGLFLWNFTWILILFIYQIAFITIFTQCVIYFDVQPATSIALLMELTRFVMKFHAFVRTNVPRILNHKNQLKFNDSEERNSAGSDFPSFRRFVYFLFAPTLIYRDEYPKNKFIRWKKVFKCLLEVVGVIFYVSFLFERYLVPRYDHFGQNQEISLCQLISSIFHCMMPGLLVFLCGFYGVLHSWMNAMAEILKFADKMFYKDWWNSTSFAIYYRTWNIVVHDWLYTYIYKDCYEHIFRKSKCLSQFIVFTISALVHEYILAFTFRFCYPVMFILFEVFGVILMFVTKKEHKSLGNVFMWLSLAVGTGIMLSLYHMEYHARKHCKPETSDFIGYFIPRSWTCNGLINKKSLKIHVEL